MRNNMMLKLAAAMLLPVTLLAVASCSKKMKGEETQGVVETPSGAAIVDTYNITATVAAIDFAKRRVTLTQPDGGKTNFTAGPNVDLSRLTVGDQISATLTEELIVALGGAGQPLAAGASDTVLVAQDASDRAGLVANAVYLTARVTSVDVANRKVTLALPDGQSKTFKVNEGPVDLSKVKPGDTANVRYAESVAINVQES